MEFFLSQKGLTPENTLFGNVTCRDEINKAAVALLGDYWGENFSFAGLGGYPSAGLTGFTAYSHHIDPAGNLLVFFGPHIGIGPDGSLGQAVRPGMEKASSSCGALLNYVKKIEADPNYKPTLNLLDVEQYFVEEKLSPYASAIVAHEEPSVEVTQRMYQVIDEALSTILPQIEFPGQIVLVGGIMVNLPQGEEDHFLPLRAQLFHDGSSMQQSTDFLDKLRA